jgi:hypothetical protein
VTSLTRDFRALDLSDVLDRALALYRDNLVTILGIYAVGYVPFWLVVGFSGHLLSGAALKAFSYKKPEALEETSALLAVFGGVSLALVLLIGILIIEPIVTGAIARAVSDQMSGRRTSIRAAYGAVRGHVSALLLSSFIRLGAVYGAYNFLSFFASLLSAAFVALQTTGLVLVLLLQLTALVVASLVYVAFAFLGQIIVLENRGTAATMTRSWRLVSGRLWRTSAIMGFVVLLVTALAAAIEAPLLIGAGLLARGDATPEGIAAMTTIFITVTAVSVILVGPILTLATTLMYYDLRVRSEGLDVEMLAAHIGRGDALP